jgi:MerR family copper efflux transcriptional regulator
MRIGDAAAAAGTTPRALRFYEQRGLLQPPPVRTATGQRVYGPDDVARVRLIRELLATGLTVEDLRVCANRFDLLEGGSLPPFARRRCSDPTGVVGQRLSALEAEIARLTALRDTLAASVRQD